MPSQKKCLWCGNLFASKGNHFYCSEACRKAHRPLRRKQLRIKQHTCPECGKIFQSARADKVFCNRLCQTRYNTNIKYFNGLRKTAVGYTTKTCWICSKTNVRRINVHHVMGKRNAEEPLIALCSGCHTLATMLGNRDMLKDEHKVADLITVARFIKGLPDAKTVVRYQNT